MISNLSPPIFFSLLLTCCAAGDAPVAPLAWKELADGSKVATAPYDRANESGGTVRCWPISGMFDCLSVFEGTWREAIRKRYTALPAQIGSQLDRAVAGSGYRCSLEADGGGYQEEIRNENSAKLIGHVYTDISGNEPNWSRDYVEAYMRDNALAAITLYFDCAYVQDALRNGSMATLGTTSIAFDKLAGNASR
ncbi:hypothetical protein [Sphingomonas sp.]|jgi:hypothetical protein|uniref:hypothetical protein n=1 Tax=Sphingomonas sp. TaxID=28214 RepID=UPI002EDB85CF